ncbi:hypothetical protein AB833_25700 [Chromatiales bacterium (ex Bugula neritina AB1)]|nr:hypothetical protein AB833_25700 [Chromatiales bacterium (ex Bugula neritina AB1)]
MQYYSFRAVNGNGAIQHGALAAANIDDLETRLKQAGLELINCRRPLLARFAGDKNFSRKELIDFTFHLEQLLGAGVPLRETLEEFRDSSGKPHMQSIASQLVEAVDAGQLFSAACGQHPKTFPQMYLSMLEVGEQSGKLVEVLTDLGLLLKWQDETLSRIQRVMMYPAFVAAVLVVVIVFVMTWLVPGLMSFVTSTGAELPWHTQTLIATSAVVSGFWWGILLCIVLLSIAIRFALARSYSFLELWHGLLLRMPLLGAVLFRIKLARFARCSSLMYGAGIGLVDTLKLSEQVVGNEVIALALREVRQKIIDGATVFESFESSQVFPMTLARVVKIGESTGAMDRAFLQAAYYYDRQSRESIEKLEQSIGPLMIVVVGMVMMWVVISVIGPIYDMVFSMQGGF